MAFSAAFFHFHYVFSHHCNMNCYGDKTWYCEKTMISCRGSCCTSLHLLSSLAHLENAACIGAFNTAFMSMSKWNRRSIISKGTNFKKTKCFCLKRLLNSLLFISKNAYLWYKFPCTWYNGVLVCNFCLFVLYKILIQSKKIYLIRCSVLHRQTSRYQQSDDDKTHLKYTLGMLGMWTKT